MSDALRAVEADAKADPEGVVVPLVTDAGTLNILMPPPQMWFEGAAEALVQGRVSDWVHLAVEDETTLAAWDATRKRYRDLEAFVNAWSEATGEDPGKSPSSEPGSGKKTRTTAPTSRR